MMLRDEIIAEEYKAARARIDKEIDFMNTLETTFVLAAGAIVAFVFNKESGQLLFFQIAMLLISCLGSYGIWRYNSHRKVLLIHEVYINENIEPILVSGPSPSVGLVSF